MLDDEGAGTAGDVIQAIDWAVENRRRYRIRVLNLSLGGTPMQSWRDDPLCQAVQRAHAAGLVVVASAGNLGKTADGTPVLGGVTVPGVCPHSLTVGALDTKGTPFRSDDEIAAYSSKGPTRYDRLVKPDLVAPGHHVRSLLAPGSTLAQRYPEKVIGSGRAARLELSGTSMAAAVVSGAVALVVDATPRLTPLGVRFLLESSAERRDGEPLLVAGAGRLNVVAALALPRHAAVPAIAGEMQATGNLAFANLSADAGSHGKVSTQMILWGTKAQSILRGTKAQTIIWSDRVVWGNRVIRGGSDTEHSILWGTTILWGAADNIVWGSAADNIVWGSAADNVVWGSAADNVVWGSAADNVVWGSAADNVVWGSAADNVVWGSAADNIIWGSAADNIIWGNAADNIVWGSSDDEAIVWGSADDGAVRGNWKVRSESGPLHGSSPLLRRNVPSLLPAHAQRVRVPQEIGTHHGRNGTGEACTVRAVHPGRHEVEHRDVLGEDPLRVVEQHATAVRVDRRGLLEHDRIDSPLPVSPR